MVQGAMYPSRYPPPFVVKRQKILFRHHHSSPADRLIHYSIGLCDFTLLIGPSSSEANMINTVKESLGEAVRVSVIRCGVVL